MGDLILLILLGLVQTWTAVQGGIVSASTLPPGREKKIHIAAFVFLGVLGIGLIVWGGVRAADAQKANRIQAEKLQTQVETTQTKLDKAQASLNSSLLSQEYMKGQLSGLSLMVGKINETGGAGMKQLAGALEKMAQSNTQSIAATNKQICTQTAVLTKRMYDFEYRRRVASDQMSERQRAAAMAAKSDDERKRIWDQQIQQYQQMSAQEHYEFRSTMLGEAINLKDELLKRLPGEPGPERGRIPAFEGSLAGPSPVADAAGYLDGLSKKLCH